MEKNLNKGVENPNDTVTITKGQLRGLLERVESLERGSRFERPKRVTERVARMRFYNDKPVVWFGNVMESRDNATGRLVGTMDIKLLGEDKPIKVNYIDFLNSVGDYQNNTVSVEIKKQTAEEIVESIGRTNATNPDEALISGKKWQDKEVDLEVVSYKYTAEVEVSDGPHKGELFTVPSNCLNQ